MIDRFERFSYAIAEINKYWHKLATDEMDVYGLKSAHCVYLVALYQSEDGLTAPQLCEQVGKDKADVSRMMRALEQKELVIKQGIHTNRYGGKYVLTEKGKQVAGHVQSLASSAVEYAGRDLSDEERDIFYHALTQIMVRLKEMDANGIPKEK